jgi:hypothetical protein
MGFVIEKSSTNDIIVHLPVQKPLAWSWIIFQMFFWKEPVQGTGASTYKNV